MVQIKISTLIHKHVRLKLCKKKQKNIFIPYSLKVCIYNLLSCDNISLLQAQKLLLTNRILQHGNRSSSAYMFLLQAIHCMLNINCSNVIHNENTPIQIYEKFHLQKTKNFSDKKLRYFSYFCSKHRLWVLVRTASARRF